MSGWLASRARWRAPLSLPRLTLSASRSSEGVWAGQAGHAPVAHVWRRQTHSAPASRAAAGQWTGAAADRAGSGPQPGWAGTRAAARAAGGRAAGGRGAAAPMAGSWSHRAEYACVLGLFGGVLLLGRLFRATAIPPPGWPQVRAGRCPLVGRRPAARHERVWCWCAGSHVIRLQACSRCRGPSLRAMTIHACQAQVAFHSISAGWLRSRPRRGQPSPACQVVPQAVCDARPGCACPTLQGLPPGWTSPCSDLDAVRGSAEPSH